MGGPDPVRRPAEQGQLGAGRSAVEIDDRREAAAADFAENSETRLEVAPALCAAPGKAERFDRRVGGEEVGVDRFDEDRDPEVGPPALQRVEISGVEHRLTQVAKPDKENARAFGQSLEKGRSHQADTVSASSIVASSTSKTGISSRIG